MLSVVYLWYVVQSARRGGSHHRLPLLGFLALAGMLPAFMMSVLSFPLELRSRIVSIDPTGKPPTRRIGNSVEFVRRERSGVRTWASAKATQRIFRQLFEEISIGTEHIPRWSTSKIVGGGWRFMALKMDLSSREADECNWS